MRPEALIRLKSSKHKGKRHRLREMRTFQSQSQAAQRGATSRPNGGGGGSVSPFSPANIILISALLILTIPVCYSESNIYLLGLFLLCAFIVHFFNKVLNTLVSCKVSFELNLCGLCFTQNFSSVLVTAEVQCSRFCFKNTNMQRFEWLF